MSDVLLHPGNIGVCADLSALSGKEAVEQGERGEDESADNEEPSSFSTQLELPHLSLCWM